MLSLGFTVIYLLSFNGIPISDDEQLFAIAARNIAVLRQIDAQPLYGDIRLEGRYAVEPFHPFLASIWYGITRLFVAGGLQSFFVLGTVYLGIGAGLLYYLIKILGYADSLAVEVVIWCGLGTILWPYSQTFFREPLMVVLLLSAWLLFEVYFSGQKKSGVVLCIFLLVLLCLALTKIIYGSALVAFFIMAIYRDRKFLSWKGMNFNFGLVFILLVSGLVLIIQLRPDIFYRYTVPALAEYWNRIIAIPREHFWQTVFLALFSVWKGYFIYSPVCFFVFLLPWVKKTDIRRRLYLFCLPICIFASVLFFQVITYGDEIWTPPWSVRFMVPTIPLIMVSALPVFEEIYSSKLGRVVFRGVGFAGMVMQLNAILINPAFYTRYLLEYLHHTESFQFWNISTAPAVNQWRLLLEGYPINLLLFRVVENFVLIPAIVVWLISGILLILLIAWVIRQLIAGQPFIFRVEVSVLGLIFCALFLFLAGRDPFYEEMTPAVEKACQKINASSGTDKAVIIQPYPGQLWLTFANRDCIDVTWYSAPADTSILLYQDSSLLVNSLLEKVRSSYSEIWVFKEYRENEVALKERMDSDWIIMSQETLDGPIPTELIMYERK